MSISVCRNVRLIVSLFVLSFGVGVFSTPAQGQVDLKPGGYFGVNVAGMGGDADELVQRRAERQFGSSATGSAQRRPGITVGGFLLVDFAGPFALKPGLRYIQRGYEFKIEDGSGNTREEPFKLGYVDVPLLARYDVPVLGGMPHLIAGPTVGFNVGATFEAQDASGNTEERDASDEIHLLDAGLEVGTGVDIELADSILIVDARYGLGLTKINDDDTDLTLKNRALIVTLGFAF